MEGLPQYCEFIFRSLTILPTVNIREKSLLAVDREKRERTILKYRKHSVLKEACH